MAVTAYDQEHLSSAQQAALQYYTDQWNQANARGDQAGMDAARIAGESIRNNAGYATSQDGSQVVKEYGYNDVAKSIIPDYKDLISQVRTVNQENNAVAQQNAQASWDFNAQEAAQNRSWQEYMSNTAHQREVQDLIRAGLNPVLSAGGNGAAVTSGATASGSPASVDFSANSVFGNYVTSLISSATAIMNQNLSAKTAVDVANLNNAMAYKLKSDFPGSDQLIGHYLGQIADYVINKGNSYTFVSNAKEAVDNVFKDLDNFLEDPKGWSDRVKDDWRRLKEALGK